MWACGVRDKGFQRARAQWLPCPYIGCRADRIPLTEPKRDQSCWESEEVRVVSLNQVGDRMGRKIRKSCCSISRYSDLMPCLSIFHVSTKNCPLVAMPQSPHFRLFMLLTPLFSFCFLPLFILTHPVDNFFSLLHMPLFSLFFSSFAHFSLPTPLHKLLFQKVDLHL